jgi:O-antigen ligase
VTCATDFAKVLAYFLMLITVVDTPQRLRAFLMSLLVFTTVLTALALMHFHGWVNIPAMAAAKELWGGDDGESGELLRLCAAGIYGNPNDLARILVVGMILALYWIMAKDSGPIRFLWVGPFLMMGYALQLTHSRGGLLALMAGMALLFKMRFGWFKSILAGFVVAPIMLVAFSGRQLEMSTSSGTGQQRIQLWAEGLSYLHNTPLFGIGMNRYQEYVGLAAHNSFVQCFVDLGFIGGTLFVSANLLALWGAHRAGHVARSVLGGEIYRLRPYMIAIIGSAIVGMFSSTRSYTIPTYTILGVAQCYQELVESRTGTPEIPLTWRLTRQLIMLGLVSLAFIYVYVRLFAVWE